MSHQIQYKYINIIKKYGSGRVVRWSWINFHCRGILLFCIIEGQVPTVLAVGAGGGCLNIFFSYVSVFSSFFLSLGDGPI